MIAVALTGGLATGKSTVGQMFVELGCHLVQADKLGHETLLPTGAAYGPTVAHFGKGILAQDGTIDRRALGAIVFQSPGELQFLNSLVHPAVEQLRQRAFARLAAEEVPGEPELIVLYESAIHIEAGIYRQFPLLVLVTCRPEVQLERAMARSGSTREEALARIAQQMPLEAKRKFAHYVIDTSESIADTRQQVARIYNELRSTFSSRKSAVRES